MSRPGESAEDEARGTAIHQPPTANPERTQLQPVDLRREQDDETPAESPPGVREEG